MVDSQLISDFEFSSLDVVRKFYSKVFDIFENQDSSNTRDTKSLTEILSEELPKTERELKPFVDAYLAHEPLTLNIINQLIPEMLDEWNFEAFEYSKIFYYSFPSKEEADLINSLGKIVFGKDMISKTPSDIKLPSELQFMLDVGYSSKKIHSMSVFDIRLPHLLAKLSQDEYIQDEEIVPKIPEKIYSYEDYIISLHFYRYTTISRAFRTSPRIFERIEDKFSFDAKESTGTFGLMKPRVVSTPYGYTAKELVNMVKDHSTNVFSADIPLTGYSAVLKLSPQTFLDEHVINLKLILDIDFSNLDSKDFLKTKGETFVKVKSLESIVVNISLDDEYALLSFNRVLGMFDENLDDGFKVYGIKLLFENYCREKGISYYSEVNIAKNDKLFYMEKYQSAQFAKENMDRIKNDLTPEVMLKIIDYSNHQYGFTADINSLHSCDCGESLLEGFFRYNKSGYIIKEDDPKLEHLQVEFPLKNLHILKKHSKDYTPKIYELESIDELIQQSKNWTPMVIGPEVEKDYIRVLQLAEDVHKASIEVDEWCEHVHTTPNYTAEEIAADSGLQDFIDTDNAILSAPDKIIESMSDSITKVMSYFEKTYGKLEGDHAKSIGEAKLRLGISELDVDHGEFHFITSTYNTLKVQHALNPAPYTQRVIDAVEAKKLSMKKEYKKLR